MTSTDPKMRSITGKLVTNMLTEREDDFTYKVTYVATFVNWLLKMVASFPPLN